MISRRSCTVSYTHLGFYIYNPEEESVPLTLADDAVYTFIDWGRDFIPSDSSQDLTVSTTTLALFEAYLETYEDGKPGMPFFMETDGDRAVSYTHLDVYKRQ